MDYESMATTMEADPLEEDQISKARRTVVQQAIRKYPDDRAAAVEYAREMTFMLGIHPDQDHEHQSVLTPQKINTTTDYQHYGVNVASLV